MFLILSLSPRCAVGYALPPSYAWDVDVRSKNPHIVNYVHLLDPYGNIDYGPGNRVCYYGKKDLLRKKSATR